MLLRPIRMLSILYNLGPGYCLITAQAIRLPELPLGSVFMSSACSCTTTDVPPLAKMEFGAAGSMEIPVSVKVAEPV